MKQKNANNGGLYPEFDRLDLHEMDQSIANFWEKEGIFQKSISSKPEDKAFIFYEGPPSANGMPGIHHVMGRTVKDLFCRYKTMQGFRVDRKGGWDTHGLPIELEVEKELGISKVDIGVKISLEEYNQKCRERVLRFKDKWDEITKKMGYWVDLDNPYITFDNDYIESVWWVISELYKKNLLYKGYTIQPYSPAAGTGLSTHELNQPGCYREETDTTVTAQFKIVKDEKSAFLFDEADEEVFFLAWTTTPWTLPSNTALAVGKKINYIKVKTYNPYTFKKVSLVLAKELVASWFKAEAQADTLTAYEASNKIIPYVLCEEYLGKDLLDIHYEQLLPYFQPESGLAFKVIPADYVTTSDGTGIVHIAPSFGADDKRVAEDAGIGTLTLVDLEGKFVDGLGEFSGRYVKDYKDEENYRSVDIDISIKLKEENKAFNVQKYKHNYPHCWRTDKPVIYYPLDSWFVKSTAVREQLIKNNNQINWKPKSTGEGRFGKWLEELKDWNLSRSRFWGIPLPIWRTEDGTEELCISSMKMLENEMEKARKALGVINKPIQDLHRPFVDDVILVSPSGKPMTRETEVIDVWFDSGSMPYAQWAYPKKNKDLVDKGIAYPADFIAEGVDQTRGWFYTLHAISTMLFDKPAFKNVIANGLVLDKDGQKMSKRLGNAIDPFTTINQYGADATRWYMISNSQPWDNLKFDLEGVDEVRRKLFGTLYNTYSFFTLYANLDGFKFEEKEVPFSERQEIDQWILSSLNTLIKQVAQAYEDYEPTQAARLIQEFVDDNLSNWYVRLNRRRFWKGEYTQDKVMAYQTLYTCLENLSLLMAPIAPFFSDFIFKNLNDVSKKNKALSVHLADFPTSNLEFIDDSLEERMSMAQNISSLVLSLRKKEKLKVRQPLAKIIIPIIEEGFQEKIERVETYILNEINVKQIEYLKDTSGIISKTIKPNFKTLGPKYGKHMKAIGAWISGFTKEDIANIEKNLSAQIEIEGELLTIDISDVEINSNDIPGWLVASDKGLTVALDISLSEDLLAEGDAREFVNKVQNLRKDSNLELTDKILIRMLVNPEFKSALDKFKNYICEELLAENIEVLTALEGGTEIDINDKKLVIEIIKS
ncbi:MAG: isoleucine--tRNA ligase [Chitinophagales bacterium]|nr:isoleucine--tRNA ligase [Chitinophagales bacterium]